MVRLSTICIAAVAALCALATPARAQNSILGGYCGEVTWAGQAPVDAWIIIRPNERWRAPYTAGPFSDGPEGAYTQNGNLFTFMSDEGQNYTITASVAGGRIIGEVTAHDGRRGIVSMTQMVPTNAAVRSSPVPPDFVLTSAAAALENDMDGLDRFVAWTWTPQGVNYWRAIRTAGALTPDAAEALRDWIRRTEAGERPQCDAQ